MDLLDASPGLPVGVIMVRLEIGSGTAQYHLRRLEAQDRVHTIVIGRRRLVFLGPLKPLLDEHASAHALLGGSAASAIAQVVIENPSCSVLDLVALSGESPRSIYYHLKRLRDAGLISSGSQRRYLNVVATPLLLQLAAQMGIGSEAAPRPWAAEGPRGLSSWTSPDEHAREGDRGD